MEKPQKYSKSFFDYFEIKDYIIEKYGPEYAKDEDKCWDYMCDYHEVRNDSYSTIPSSKHHSLSLKDNKFLQAVEEEFGEDLEVWISW